MKILFIVFFTLLSLTTFSQTVITQGSFWTNDKTHWVISNDIIIIKKENGTILSTFKVKEKYWTAAFKDYRGLKFLQVYDERPDNCSECGQIQLIYRIGQNKFDRIIYTSEKGAVVPYAVIQCISCETLKPN